ncbi:hypothetical protein AJ80_01539 [Polytolypa hystricis UAMH7299]|uniref:Uncharacterized protein n=1 Tax=Polytolypa hystricis (strain UAMH7299) TaxID=1447883 RepID=A0A2B7YZK9_POLH7|nr:hypothetical protein AJ80_01539 [Polytolypa hystricis UAMH7299]
MASPLAEQMRRPMPPPPVYLRSSPPPPPPSSQPPPPPSAPAPGSPEAKIRTIPHRKPISLPPVDINNNAVFHNSPVSPVRIDDLAALPQASVAEIADIRTYTGDRGSLEQDIQGVYLPPRRDSLAPTAYPQPTHETLAYRSKPEHDISHAIPNIPNISNIPNIPTHLRRRSNGVPQRNESSGEASPNNSRENSPRDSVESIREENVPYEPLRYHHQPFPEHVVGRGGHRGSKSTLQSTSDSSSSGDPNASRNRLAPGRAVSGGLSLPRPLSAYSSASDLAGRGRTQSPQLSPYAHVRGVSSHSASPDTRPLSFVDLLNVPYPQPPPAPTTLNNDHLRNSVGNNASLLSHKQTFEMYLANVKKTNDPGAQYEFAVFMIHAAQEAEPALSEKRADIPKAELLREARVILQRLADRSYPYAQYYLGDGYASGLLNKGKMDLDKAFTLFIAASKHGHAEAGYRAALCYEFGWGSRQDGAKAVQFFRQAASKNHPGAMLRLAKACLAGDMGLNKRYREGLTWLKRAAESADLQYNGAPYELGLLHESGFGADVFQDESYAAQLFTKSAELGHADANYRMGDAYEHGKLGCPRDPALSVHFYTGAAQLGHPVAMMALCAWFMVGAEPMLEKDEYEAYEWARRAAELGLAKAQYAVGYFTEMGIGCRRDPLEANVWYVRAADQGDERARHRLQAIQAAASGMDPNSAASKKLKRQPGDSPGDKSGKGKRFGIF